VIIPWFVPLNHQLTDAFIAVHYSDILGWLLIRIWWWRFPVRDTRFDNQPRYRIEFEWVKLSMESYCHGVIRLCGDRKWVMDLFVAWWKIEVMHVGWQKAGKIKMRHTNKWCSGSSHEFRIQ
jgi:hypothetical protein